MPTRRNFLSKCLGGVGLAAATSVPAVLKAEEVNATRDAAIEAALNSPVPSPDACNELRVRTDFHPANTKILLGKERLGLIQELLVQFSTNDKSWVGIKMVLPFSSCLLPEGLVLPKLVSGREAWSSPLLKIGNKILPLWVCSFMQDHVSQLTNVFACCFTDVELFNVPSPQFMRCNECGYYARICKNDKAEMFAKSFIEHNTCPVCQNSTIRELVTAFSELKPYRLYMTPDLSVVSTWDEKKNGEMPSVGMKMPENLDMNNRSRWFYTEADNGPVAQIVPIPHLLNDVFLNAACKRPYDA